MLSCSLRELWQSIPAPRPTSQRSGRTSAALFLCTAAPTSSAPASLCHSLNCPHNWKRQEDGDQSMPIQTPTRARTTRVEGWTPNTLLFLLFCSPSSNGLYKLVAGSCYFSVRFFPPLFFLWCLLQSIPVRLAKRKYNTITSTSTPIDLGRCLCSWTHFFFFFFYSHGILHCKMCATWCSISWKPLKHVPQIHRREDDTDRAGYRVD